MRIEYIAPEPERAHVLRIGLRFESQVDGLLKDEIAEIAVRKSHFNSLTNGARISYAYQAYQWHFQRDRAIRDKWDSDDLAAEQAQFLVRAIDVVAGQVSVEIKHHGLVYTGAVDRGASPAEFEANCRSAFAAHEAQVQAEKALLSAYTISK